MDQQRPMRAKRDLFRATKPFAREHRLLSWWHFASTLVILLGLLGITCLDVAWPVRLSASVFASLLLVRFFVIYHDYLHGAILRRAWLAEVIFTVFGIYIAAPRSVWKHSHDYHHHHNGQFFGAGHGTFPLMSTEDYARASAWQRIWYRSVRHPLTMLLGYVTIFLYSMCLHQVTRKPWQHYDAGLALLLHAAVITLLAIFAPGILLFTFLLPILLSAALGAYLFYAQHNFPAARFRNRGRWDYVAAALESSSYLRLNAVLHWFTGNIGYHHVHHLNARIPFYRLPEAMAAIAELRSVGTTSLHPLDIYRCLRLKLWDSRSNRLVPFS